MKALVAALALGLCPALTAAPATLLQQIDALAADTWAEGDFGFRFISVEPYLKAVLVEFDITHPRAKAVLRNVNTYRDGPEGTIYYPDGKNWSAEVSGRNGKWRVIIWAKDKHPIHRKLTPAIKNGLTRAILWTETTILKRSNL